MRFDVGNERAVQQYVSTDYGAYGNSVNMNGLDTQLLRQRMEEKYHEALLDVAKDAQKKWNKASIDLQVYEAKLDIKEKERERQKSQYVQLGLVNGRVQVTSCNLRTSVEPIIVSDLEQPVLEILKRIEDEFDTAYRIKFVIGGCFQIIYLDREKAESGSYLLRKFASAGAIFKADSLARKKEYVHLLLAYLLNQKPSIYWIADNEGWFEFPDEGWKYVEKGAVTWKKVCKMSR